MSKLWITPKSTMENQRSSDLLDSLICYLKGGGRLMYLPKMLFLLYWNTREKLILLN
jgi:hypothetical protein